MARALMVMGTSSNVGKSVLCTALCRMLKQDGYRVAPFKAQNMSLNSAITPSGREIGRAQAVQAEACGIVPVEHMNPVLLKPTATGVSQIVLQGKAIGTASAYAYGVQRFQQIWQAVEASYRWLAERYEIIVIEGAGSPVEMNLKDRDIANMRTAEMTNADVILVADIDKGGVFASVYGTVELLTPTERQRVKGIVINKFRGEPAWFEDGRRLIESYTGIPVLGVLPYLDDVGIDEEDSVALTSFRYQPHRAASNAKDRLKVCIVSLPYMSNFNDFDPLFDEPCLSVKFCRDVDGLSDAHIVILPGTKNTMHDLAWLRRHGWDEAIRAACDRGAHVIGICGGYQMLGEDVVDPDGIESVDATHMMGLGLLPVRTEWQTEKRTTLVHGAVDYKGMPIPVRGYEIHMGITTYLEGALPFARIAAADGSANEVDGAVSYGWRVFGTYLHGLFDNDEFRWMWIDGVRESFGLAAVDWLGQPSFESKREANYDRLANIFRKHLNLSILSL